MSMIDKEAFLMPIITPRWTTIQLSACKSECLDFELIVDHWYIIQIETEKRKYTRVKAKLVQIDKTTSDYSCDNIPEYECYFDFAGEEYSYYIDERYRKTTDVAFEHVCILCGEVPSTKPTEK